MRVFVLFPMMLLVVTVQGSDAGREDPQERPRVLCGRMLANVDAEQHALMLRGQREPGLVDECCLKPCYNSELLSYC